MHGPLCVHLLGHATVRFSRSGSEMGPKIRLGFPMKIKEEGKVDSKCCPLLFRHHWKYHSVVRLIRAGILRAVTH